jgi:hypothetical protein
MVELDSINIILQLVMWFRGEVPDKGQLISKANFEVFI